MQIVEVSCETQGGFDVFGLRSFVSACQKHNQLQAPLFVINPVARSVMNPELGNTIAHGLRIAGISKSETLDSNEHPRPSARIAKTLEPPLELPGFADFYHK